MPDFYQNIPLGIDPVAFSLGSFPVRWYSLCYLAGFLTTYFLLLWRISQRERHPAHVSRDLLDVLLFVFICSLIGGRLGYVLLYRPAYFFTQPWEIISPFGQGGFFVGIFGMSYYGALIGAIMALWIYCRKNGKSFWGLSDFIVPAVPAGYFFGRVGNFLNGELYGRITDSPWGMHFAVDRDVLRWPSQLIEAILEGAVLFLFLWAMRNRMTYPGRITLIYVTGYALARFMGEFFREPDSGTELLAGIFTFSQSLSIVSVIIACIFFRTLRKKRVVV